MLKTYINARTNYTTADFLPSVAYVSDGEIADTMYDSFIILPSPTLVQDQQLKKTDYLQYINLIYSEGYNLNALEAAVGQTKQALDLKDYRAGVFLPLFRPLDSVTSFGEINGVQMDCSTYSGKVNVLKWYVGQHIEAFNQKNYKNIAVAGFYWCDEYLSSVNKAYMLEVNTYIKQLGLESIYSAYYNSSDYSRWKNYGFTKASMQSNYFPAVPDSPNAGPISRLTDNIIRTNLSRMGLEIELAGYMDTVGITGFKETLKVDVNNNRMAGYHIYYMDSGLNPVAYLAGNSDSFVRSAYDELHAFIKGTLASNNIVF